MNPQWYVLYMEFGEVKRQDFGEDEFQAKAFAKQAENAMVCYGF